MAAPPCPGAPQALAKKFCFKPEISVAGGVGQGQDLKPLLNLGASRASSLVVSNKRFPDSGFLGMNDAANFTRLEHAQYGY